MHHSLELLPDTLAICRLMPGAPIPSWALEPGRFSTVSRTADELSITTVQRSIPAGVPCEGDYRALRVRGPLLFDLVGVLAAIAAPLAAAGLSIFAISTYDTDYVLVKARDLEPALQALQGAGHRIIPPETGIY
ncbi:MAG: ACT domain-containing protein [Gemmatimonadales bacterium]